MAMCARLSWILSPSQKIEFVMNRYFRDPDFKTQMEAKLLEDEPEVPEVPKVHLRGSTGWFIERLVLCMGMAQLLYKYLSQIQIPGIDPADSARLVIKLIDLETLSMKIQTTCNKLESVKQLIIGLPISPNRLGTIAAAITHMKVIMDQYGEFTACYNRSQVGVNTWAQRVADFMGSLGVCDKSVEDWRSALTVFDEIHAVLVAMRGREQSRLDLEESTRDNALAAYADVVQALDEP